jgi:hypothetical protein
MAPAQALARLYASAGLHANLFSSSFKLKSKTRIGARVVKRCDAPVSPVARVLRHPGVSEPDKKKLQALRAVSDPVVLLAEVRAAQTDLGERMDRCGASPDNAAAASMQTDLERFTSGLKPAWREGEQRRIHRRPYRGRKPLPRCVRMLDRHTAQITEHRLHRTLQRPHVLRFKAIQGKLDQALAGCLRRTGRGCPVRRDPGWRSFHIPPTAAQ